MDGGLFLRVRRGWTGAPKTEPASRHIGGVWTVTFMTGNDEGM
jgi:hypothetical protein